MKNFVWLLLGFLIITSCKELDKLTQFTMDYDSSVTIEKTAVIDLPITVLTPDMETNSESQFEINDTRKDLVEEIRLEQMKMTITSPSGQTFSFLDKITVSIEAEGLEEIVIAEKDVPEDAGNTLTLETTGKDVQAYIKKDSFRLKVNTITDEAISKDIDIDIHSEFFVNAKILGV